MLWNIPIWNSDVNFTILFNPNSLIEGHRKKLALNEAQALASITALDENQNIVRYYQTWFENDHMYLVMEYCPKSLNGLRKKQKQFSEKEIKKILHDILIGL